MSINNKSTTINNATTKFATIDILSIPFAKTTRGEFVNKLHNNIQLNKKTFVVTANPEIVIAANDNPQYRRAITAANYIVADGIGIVKAAQLLKTPLPERVTGYDIFIDLLAIANDNCYNVYLLGATEATLTTAITNIEKNYPKANIVGSHHGYFDQSSEEIKIEIATKKPDLIFVALGMPRQEQWIAENIGEFTKGIFIGVGGSFDVIAGTVKRAPIAWQIANLEWLYRILKQPQRLKRSLALPKFVLKVFKQKLTGSTTNRLK